ncbi:MAG: PaaI family thioesterase, partial [Magnetospirillum sp.]
LRKAEACDIIAEARLLKLGRRLAVGAVEMVDAGSDELVAYATGSYAIP